MTIGSPQPHKGGYAVAEWTLIILLALDVLIAYTIIIGW